MQVCVWDLREGRSEVVDFVWTGSVGFCQCSTLETNPGNFLLAFAGEQTEEVRWCGCDCGLLQRPEQSARQKQTVKNNRFSVEFDFTSFKMIDDSCQSFNLHNVLCVTFNMIVPTNLLNIHGGFFSPREMTRTPSCFQCSN